ncbi:hypothetical protein [Massilia aquatica]|uniref:Secreted protein n=1 Tax=Massilia aquatica TaxID=2609000 RepID=A0ABX0MJ03_9BURK|nr:hypothetical protein [Massilia aquatica]NHZ44252.1 hypothetical protein [Massilia aquatica]
MHFEIKKPLISVAFFSPVLLSLAAQYDGLPACSCTLRLLAGATRGPPLRLALTAGGGFLDQFLCMFNRSNRDQISPPAGL